MDILKKFIVLWLNPTNDYDLTSSNVYEPTIEMAIAAANLFFGTDNVADVEEAKDFVTRVTYRVGTGGGAYLSPGGYSKYGERLGAVQNGELEHSHVYGLQQAEEHAQEYFNQPSKYQDQHRATTLTIHKIVEYTDTVATINYKETL